MEPERLSHYRQLLDGKLEELKQTWRPERNQGLASDESEQATNAHAEWVGALTSRQNKLLIEQVRAAKERIGDGSYGYCFDCDEEISPKRLKAIPWATHCVSCSSKDQSVSAASAPPKKERRSDSNLRPQAVAEDPGRLQPTIPVTSSQVTSISFTPLSWETK